MAKKDTALVIVESPSKAKKITSYLGDNVKVLASVGHIRDLPKFFMGVDVKNHFTPTYQVPTDKKKVVADLKTAANKAATIYLASDPDREGESIAWHLKEELSKDLKGEHRFLRVRYNEVTKSAVLDAISHPTEIDQNLVNAQQARRIEDRLSGFRISSLISKAVSGAKSAGRVQSVALRLIVDRERAVQAFQTTPYWLLGAMVTNDNPQKVSMDTPITFEARLNTIDGSIPKFKAYDKEHVGIADEKLAYAYRDDLTAHKTLKVASVDKKFVTKRPQPPFITSTLQQASSNLLGYSPDTTMRLAQALYEEGFITYMRTDGMTVSATIRTAVEEEITKLFGKDCVPEKPNVYSSKVKNAQEAHEPIRPTNVKLDRLPAGSDAMQAKLYELIWRRFVASQMASARFERTTLTLIPETPPALQHAYAFTASAQKVVFKGFLNVMTYGRDTVNENDVSELPAVAQGDTLLCKEWLLEAKETQPPARFNEASLVKALEENGIGRPSTYAATIRTLLARDYVKSNKGHVLTPTDSGVAATDFLMKEMPDFINVEFTAQMEEALDKIADGSCNWESEVGAFYKQLLTWIIAPKTETDALIGQLNQVTTWVPPQPKWDEEKIFHSMVDAYQTDGYLLKTQTSKLREMALRYRDQLPGLEAAIGPLPEPVDTAEIEALFKAIEDKTLNGWEQRFTDSLRDQFAKKGSLSPKQLAILNRVAHPEAKGDQPDNEAASNELLAALATVSEWKAPTTRGKRTFDDQDFLKSLKTQLAERHFLSVKQFDALKRLVRGYQEQIPNYAALAEKFEIKAAVRRTASTGAKKTKKTKTAKTTK